MPTTFTALDLYQQTRPAELATDDAKRNLREAIENCGVRVPILTATDREAFAHVSLCGLDCSAFMRRLFTAEFFYERGGESYFGMIHQQFDIWFQPEPADPDGMVVTFRPKSY